MAYASASLIGTHSFCVGGCDASQHVTSAFRLAWIDDRVQISALPDRPHPLPTPQVLGGRYPLYRWRPIRPPDSSTLHSAWSLDLADPDARWQAIDVWPGRPRMLAMAASLDNAFWLLGGVDLETNQTAASQRVYLKDAYRYRPGQGWQRIADLPYALAAAPSPTPVTSQAVVLLGGDDGTQVGAEPTQHRGFNRSILIYNHRSQAWQIDGALNDSPQVTVPCVPWRDPALRPPLGVYQVVRFALALGHLKCGCSSSATKD